MKLNKDDFKQIIVDVLAENFGVDNDTNEIIKCENLGCRRCLFDKYPHDCSVKYCSEYFTANYDEISIE